MRQLWWYLLPVVFAAATGGVLLAINAHAPTARHKAKAEILSRAITPPPRVLPRTDIPVSPTSALKLNAERPFDTTDIPPPRPFRFVGDSASRDRALACLAAAAWYEAGDDPEGEQAVIQSVLNRARHPAFPATICGVVFQGQERVTGCQYSFVCDGALARTPSAAAWQRARLVANSMMSGTVAPTVGYATHYHTDWVVPYWSADLVKVAKVHTQIFYRWQGYWGTPSAFRRGVATPEPIIAALSRLAPAHEVTTTVVTEAATSNSVVPAVEIARDLPSPIIVPGATERSLRGTLVRVQPSRDTFFLQLADDQFAGNYALAALAVCKLHQGCRVFGWRNPMQMARAFPLDGPQRQALTFYYERGEKDLERALWNCRQAPRRRPEQCLPTEDSTLAELTDVQ